MNMYAEKISVSQPTRVKYIDLLKGVGIALMVAIHIGFGDVFSHFLHAFVMQLFFFITGYLYRDKFNTTPIEFAKKTARKLLIPYISYGMFNYAVWFILSVDDVSGKALISPLAHLLTWNHTGVPIAGALWFLTTLFFANLIYYFLNRYIKNTKLISLIVVLIAALGTCWGGEHYKHSASAIGRCLTCCTRIHPCWQTI